MPNDGSRVAVIGSNGQGGWVACVDVGKKVVLWEKRRGDRERDTSAFHDGDFSADGKVFYAGGTHGELYAYDAGTGKYLSMCEVKDRVERVVASPDGKLVAVGLANGEGTVCLIDTAKSKVVHKIATGLNVIRGIGFSPDSQLLAAAGAGSSQIKIYKVSSPPPPAQPNQPAVPAVPAVPAPTPVPGSEVPKPGGSAPAADQKPGGQPGP
jgi:WD40 repeat protein